MKKRRTQELYQNGDENNVSKAVVDITNEMAKIGLATTTSENNNKKTPKRGTTPKTPKNKSRPVGSAAKKSVRIAAKPPTTSGGGGSGNASGSGSGTENKSRPKSSKLRK